MSDKPTKKVPLWLTVLILLAALGASFWLYGYTPANAEETKTPPQICADGNGLCISEKERQRGYESTQTMTRMLEDRSCTVHNTPPYVRGCTPLQVQDLLVCGPGTKLVGSQCLCDADIPNAPCAKN